MTKTTNRVIAVMQDLMFMVQIQDVAKRAGLETTAVKTKSKALEKAMEGPVLIVIDLNFAAAEPLALIQVLKADPNTRDIHLLAFVSHVQADLRAAAAEAGCDTVVPRSAFAQRLPEVIQQRVSSPRPT